MTLREKQSAFVVLISRLIQRADQLGYELTFGEVYRTPEQAALNAKHGVGIANSLHTKRLAVDFNLFQKGIWLNRSEDFKPLGEYWESLSTADLKCCWGGRFASLPDGNHFSIEHEGVR